MKNIFNKTNAPCLAIGTLATLALLTSGVFALAPYVGFLATVAALSVGLPFIIGGAIISAVVVALSAVVISKSSTISPQKKFESRVDQRKEEEPKERAELKAKGLLPDTIAFPYKDAETSSLENQLANQVLSKSQDKSSKSSGSKFTLKHAVLGSAVLGSAVLVAPVLVASVLDSILGLTASNLSNAVGNPVNSTKSGVSISMPVCPRLTMQCQIDEYSNTLENALKSAENSFNIPEKGSLNNESSIYNKVSSAFSSVWGSLGNLASGSNKGAHDRSEPKWYKDLHKSETMKEIIDGDVLSTLFREGGNSSDDQCAKLNFTESTHTESSKTVGSNQIPVAKYSSADTYPTTNLFINSSLPVATSLVVTAN